MENTAIKIKTASEVEAMKKAGSMTAYVMRELGKQVKAGITTAYLDELAQDLIFKMNAHPAFKGYMGYPATICSSIDDEVVHGIPSKNRILKEGSIISIDLGVKYEGFYGDMTVTFPIGKISERVQRLIDVTRGSLYKGIANAVSGKRLGDISYAVQSYVESKGYSVVRKFVGHGIGRQLHEEPEVPNFGLPGRGPLLKDGMTLAIEPMVNEGSADVRILDNGWTAVTADHLLSCHFEHTILIQGREPLILTELENG